MPRKSPSPDMVQIATLPNGAPVTAPADTETARAIAAELTATLGLARLGYEVHSIHVWPDTSIVTVSGTAEHDPAFEPTAFAVKVTA